VDIKAYGLRYKDLLGLHVRSGRPLVADGRRFETGTIWRAVSTYSGRFSLVTFLGDEIAGFRAYKAKHVAPRSFSLVRDLPVRVLFKKLDKPGEFFMAFMQDDGTQLAPSSHAISERGQLVLTFDKVDIVELGPDDPFVSTVLRGLQANVTFDDPKRAPSELVGKPRAPKKPKKGGRPRGKSSRLR
jgi:hypothetical protein